MRASGLLKVCEAQINKIIKDAEKAKTVIGEKFLS